MGVSKKEQQEYLKQLGLYIVSLRLQKGIKQYVLADALDIDVHVMRRIEKGEMNIQILFLFKLASELGVSADSFINLPTGNEES